MTVGRLSEFKLLKSSSHHVCEPSLGHHSPQRNQPFGEVLGFPIFYADGGSSELDRSMSETNQAENTTLFWFQASKLCAFVTCWLHLLARHIVKLLPLIISIRNIANLQK